jgi:hypothetical protein
MSVQLNSLSKRVDVVWDQVIDKPENSKKKENEEQIENELERGMDFNEETPEGHTLRRPETTPIVGTRITRPTKCFNRILTRERLGKTLWNMRRIMTTTART